LRSPFASPAARTSTGTIERHRVKHVLGGKTSPPKSLNLPPGGNRSLGTSLDRTPTPRRSNANIPPQVAPAPMPANELGEPRITPLTRFVVLALRASSSLIRASSRACVPRWRISFSRLCNSPLWISSILPSSSHHPISYTRAAHLSFIPLCSSEVSSIIPSSHLIHQSGAFILYSFVFQ